MRVLGTIGLLALTLVLCAWPVAAQGGGDAGRGGAAGSDPGRPVEQPQGDGCTDCTPIHDRDRDQEHGGDCGGQAEADPPRDQSREGSTDSREPAQHRAQDTEQAETREQAQDGAGEGCDPQASCQQPQSQEGEQVQAQPQEGERVQAQTQAGEPAETQTQTRTGDPVQTRAQEGEQVATQSRDRQNAGGDGEATDPAEGPPDVAFRPAPGTAEATRLGSRMNDVLLQLIARLRLRLQLLRVMPQ